MAEERAKRAGGARMFLRALAARCPHCGHRPVTRRWLYLLDVCPRCRLRLDRGEHDYFLGAMVFNMAFAEGIFAVGLLAVIYATYPAPPWPAIYVGGIAAMILAPIALYPISKLCWLAFDLLFRPPQPGDFDTPAPADGARR
jgi:uncharacterized protein (DUF983 family)